MTRPIAVVCSIGMLAGETCGAVTVYTNEQQWQNAAGSFSSITFVGHSEFTHLTNQYSNLGIHFTDGNNLVDNSPSFPSDSWGLISSQPTGFANIEMSFIQPIYCFGFDYIGGLQFELFRAGELVFNSLVYQAGFFPFVGVVSTEPFDVVNAHDWLDPTVAIDNIHFGPPIPVPSAIGLLAALLVRPGARRRRTQ